MYICNLSYSSTALAESELEYNDQHVSTSVYLRVPLAKIPPHIDTGTRVFLNLRRQLCA